MTDKPRKRSLTTSSPAPTVGELLPLPGLVMAAAGLRLFRALTISEALWWAVVTTTTTGYGDLTPVSWPGRLIAAVVMLSSILFVLPLLIGHIAAKLIENQDAFTHHEQEELKAEIAALRADLARLVAAREARGSEP